MEQAVVRARLEAPTLTEWGLTGISTALLILSFPDFDLYLLAWISLAPVLVAIARRPAPFRALILGWAMGTVFFYTTCYWLTYSMTHYGGLPPVVAYLLLIPGAMVTGVFPGLFASLLALALKRWGPLALALAPVLWPATEWLRLGVTGQLWNALGYSQAYHPMLIQSARWGGVYAVSFLILMGNTSVALLFVRRSTRNVAASAIMILVGLSAISLSATTVDKLDDLRSTADSSTLTIIALQPNVPMTAIKSTEETQALVERHFDLSTNALASQSGKRPTLVIWPESPMNFTYASTRAFQERLANFTRDHGTSLLFNSLEPAPADGAYNSALLVNEEGRLISQYDKIRLMPFGEYVPLPQWLPGASLIGGLVGEFTPGSNYTLMPIGAEGLRAGVFICIESAYPFIARRMTHEGARFLINISNDGYLGPTAVMRQHLANVVFRAVENHRPVVRVTNTGLSAFIDAEGRIKDQTSAYNADVRIWSVTPTSSAITAYTKYGDLFVQVCAAITAIVFVALLWWRFLRA